MKISVRLLLIAAVGLGVLMSACGDSGGGSSSAAGTSTTASEAPGTAKITSFEVPASVDCGGKTSTMVTVTYATTGAKKQDLYVDGRPEPGTDAPSGSLQTTVHCDLLPHTFVLIAYDAAGRRTPVEKKMTTKL